MTHWATEYIGRPWVFGAQGPDAFDCWSFVRWVQSRQFNLELPAITAPKNWIEAHDLIKYHEERERWVSIVGDPLEGDIVLMARNRDPVHIGVCVHANGVVGVLHCMSPSGVVFQRPADLRVSGWGKLTYFRHDRHTNS